MLVVEPSWEFSGFRCGDRRFWLAGHSIFPLVPPCRFLRRNSTLWQICHEAKHHISIRYKALQMVSQAYRHRSLSRILCHKHIVADLPQQRVAARVCTNFYVWQICHKNIVADLPQGEPYVTNLYQYIRKFRFYNQFKMWQICHMKSGLCLELFWRSK